MEFYTAFHQKRPVRLSEPTRLFAWESLHGKYGDEATKTPAVSMDGVAGFASMTPQQQYNNAIAKIAADAPLRICAAEKVSGAATLGMAIEHLVPATFHGEKLWGSVSHLTLGFWRVLREGIDAIEQQVLVRLAEEGDDAKRAQLTGMKSVIDAMRIWHKRYVSALKERGAAHIHALLRVPFAPAQNFHEAVQSLWFTFAFMRLCGNWPGIGRLDEMLGGYLKQDLETGALTIEEAREILASMFIKGCEWIRSDAPVGSGDAQHYQNVVLAGIDAEGNEVTNEVTYLVLDIVEELGISDFPITVRVSDKTSPRLLTRVAEVMRHGGGVVAVYNEPLIIDSLTRFGYSVPEARRFANDGCWEVQVPGKTLFHYVPFDGLRILLDDTLHVSDETPVHFDSMDTLYAAFKENLRTAMEQIYHNTVVRFTGKEPGAIWEWNAAEDIPCSAVSLLEEGCIESGRSYINGGPAYTVISPHIGGAPDVGNSLYAIDRLVFQEKKVTFDQLMDILRHNWDGNEALRQYALNRYSYYGNDNDAADAYTVRVLNDFADLVAPLNGRSPILFPPGVSTFGRQLEWAPQRAATPSGHKRGEVLSGNASPTPGTDAEGATALICSYCKADLGRQVNGAALDVKLYPATVQGENGTAALVSLIKGFVALGGFFMQLDVLDAAALRAAQENPAAYKTLSVRVSGWNARFVTLNKEWQDMIIARTAQEL